MAKKKKRSATSGRDITTPIPYRHVPDVPPRANRQKVNGNKLRVEPLLNTDRRRFNPTKSIAPLEGSKKSDGRIKIKPSDAINKARHLYLKTHLITNSPLKYMRRKYGISTLTERLSFNAPKRLELCIRRAIRSRVIHAKGHAGKRGQKRPNRNFWSAISC